MNSAVVIVAYDRVKEFEDLLSMLMKANFFGSVDLVLSVDYSCSQDSIISVFNAAYWRHGKKILNAHNSNV